MINDDQISTTINFPLEQTLGMLTPLEQGNIIPLDDQEIEEKENLSDSEKLQADFETARKNITTVIGVGTEAVKFLGALATASQQPEMFMTLSDLIKNISDNSEKLLKVHKTLQEITKKKPSTNIEKQENVFIGSTADMLKIIKDMKR